MEWRFDGAGPIYGQIVEKIKLAVASGELRAGERLPAVRELAIQAGVNPNTVQRALAELEREGILFSQRTSGRFVTEDGELLSTLRRELAERSISDFLTSMERLGFSRRELSELLESELSKGD